MIILTFGLYLNISFKLAPMLSFNPGKTNFPSNSFFSDEISKAALLTEFLIEIKYKIKIAAANTAITAKNIFLRVCSGLDLIFSIKLFMIICHSNFNATTFVSPCGKSFFLTLNLDKNSVFSAPIALRNLSAPSNLTASFGI